MSSQVVSVIDGDVTLGICSYACRPCSFRQSVKAVGPQYASVATPALDAAPCICMRLYTPALTPSGLLLSQLAAWRARTASRAARAASRAAEASAAKQSNRACSAATPLIAAWPRGPARVSQTREPRPSARPAASQPPAPQLCGGATCHQPSQSRALSEPWPQRARTCSRSRSVS